MEAQALVPAAQYVRFIRTPGPMTCSMTRRTNRPDSVFRGELQALCSTQFP